MASQRKNTEPSKPRRRPATTPEEREKQIAALAYDEAEKQIREGRATSQVITHFLKVGSARELLEQAKLANENHLLEVKAETMASMKNIEELYTEALNAMRGYQGQEVPEEEEFDD